MSWEDKEKTMMFKVQAEEANQARDILHQVYKALKEKGYNPINQLVGYLLSGDPAYITSHGNARSLIDPSPGKGRFTGGTGQKLFK